MNVSSTNDFDYPMVIRDYWGNELKVDRFDLEDNQEWDSFIESLINVRRSYLERKK